MCRINNKIRLFASFLNILRDYFNVSEFDQLFAYKIHYLVCVESVPVNVNVIEDFSLFNIYDNFRALKNGPVEWDIYVNRDIIPGWIYDKDSARFKETPWIEDLTNNPNPEELELMRQSFEFLKMNLSLTVDYDPNNRDNIDNLIDLTHKLKLWKHTFEKYGEQERLLTKSRHNRILEKNSYQEQLVANWNPLEA